MVQTEWQAIASFSFHKLPLKTQPATVEVMTVDGVGCDKKNLCVVIPSSDTETFIHQQRRWKPPDRKSCTFKPVKVVDHLGQSMDAGLRIMLKRPTTANDIMLRRWLSWYIQ